MRARVLRVCVIALGALVVAAPASAQAKPTSASRAIAIRILHPEEAEETLAVAAAPPVTYASSGGLVYRDGLITTGGAWVRARTAPLPKARARAGAIVRAVSVFGGEITIGALSTKAWANATPKRADGGLDGSWLAEVVILGESVRAVPNMRVTLGDWGYAVLLEQAVVRDTRARTGRRTSVSGVHVYLTADHAGLPAGSQIVIGYAEAAASAPRPVAREAQRPGGEAVGEAGDEAGAPVGRPTGPSRDPAPQPPGAKPKPPPVVQSPPPEVKPKLTADGYVFPVYGPSTFSDDFGAARAVTGWHHGNDIFAPVGAPVLAVTDGTVFLVGWNDVGGNRVWLRDNEGNEFYYAHLSAFSPLAVAGARVQAGDVIGFVGATGDAVGTPPHLHFEIHPAALLGLGYDGVINPYPYLLAWRRLADASFDWGPPKPGKAPPPGLVLLQAEDISTVSGLDPDGLSRAMEMPAVFGEALTGAEPPLVPSG